MGRIDEGGREKEKYALSVQNIRNTFLILSCTPLPSEQPQFVRAWTRQCVKSNPPGCWPMLTPTLPTFVSSWMDVLYVVDHSWYTRETAGREKPSSVAVLDTVKPVRLAPTTIPCSKALKSFVFPIHPQNSAHTQSMSQLSQVFKILL
jgi:hypothetical protein